MPLVAVTARKVYVLSRHMCTRAVPLRRVPLAAVTARTPAFAWIDDIAFKSLILDMMLLTDFAQILCVTRKHVKFYRHNQANCLHLFIFVLHCKEVWRLLIRGAPGVTYKGDGVTYKGDGVTYKEGPPL